VLKLAFSSLWRKFVSSSERSICMKLSIKKLFNCIWNEKVWSILWSILLIWSKLWSRFSAKQFAFFHEIQCYDIFLNKSSTFLSKSLIFLNTVFVENSSKNRPHKKLAWLNRSEKTQELELRSNSSLSPTWSPSPSSSPSWTWWTATGAGWPGVDVMITIFGDFRQFSAKKFAFFSKNNGMITIFGKTSSSLSKKRQFFR
jgi:hypothetical protein